MLDDQALSTDNPRARNGAEALARGVIPILAGRARRRTDRIVAGRLLVAAASPDPRAIGRTASDLLAEGVTASAILDHAIPAAARALGEDWCRDRSSFAAVTVGCMRLQSLIRPLEKPRPDFGGPNAPSAIVVLRKGRQHALGAAVAASQLRRAGVGTVAALGRPDIETLELVRHGRFGMIALSLPCGTDLESETRFIRSLRAAAPGASIVAGGSAVEGGEAAALATLGVDHAGTNIVEAARRCGLISAEPIPLPLPKGWMR
ncbi:B12 binding protein [Hasllibacter halocynthiae]|uniref:B12 binding protein n=1 Tax=Hasllibacter halocynthiae TaxID=595589 RepID=A0A2T0X2R5_9RHOB|nr:cobalamin-dependent protein [Hasllibacter halocynthiae]PRY93236.1 B12 binding protein [Hasllibacter halocynthiae]